MLACLVLRSIVNELDLQGLRRGFDWHQNPRKKINRPIMRPWQRDEEKCALPQMRRLLFLQESKLLLQQLKLELQLLPIFLLRPLFRIPIFLSHKVPPLSIGGRRMRCLRRFLSFFIEKVLRLSNLLNRRRLPARENELIRKRKSHKLPIWMRSRGKEFAKKLSWYLSKPSPESERGRVKGSDWVG